jgi:hypothetical protein
MFKLLEEDFGQFVKTRNRNIESVLSHIGRIFPGRSMGPKEDKDLI